jgi:hypothetical protein
MQEGMLRVGIASGAFPLIPPSSMQCLATSTERKRFLGGIVRGIAKRM